MKMLPIARYAKFARLKSIPLLPKQTFEMRARKGGIVPSHCQKTEMIAPALFMRTRSLRKTQADLLLLPTHCTGRTTLSGYWLNQQ